MSKVLDVSTSCNHGSIKLPPGGRTRVSRPPLIASSLDTLEVSLNMEISSKGCKTLDRFYNLKKRLQESSSAMCAAVTFETDRFFSWNLQRQGNKLYSYILKSGDVTLMLSTRDHESTVPNVKIEIGSISCHTGSFDIYRQAVLWLQVVGFTVHKEVVSRLDLCVDSVGTAIDGTGCSNLYRWVRRGRKFATYYEGTSLTGVQIGKKNIVLRIYDKIEELKRNETKRKFFYEKWGLTEDEQEKNPVPVTRVEFQLRREVLKEFETPFNTVSEVEANLDAIWQYCTQDWARITNRSVTLDRSNNHQNLVSSSKWWQSIQLAIFHRPIPATYRKKKNVIKNLPALIEQARGCLLNVAAAAQLSMRDAEGIVNTISSVIATEFYRYMNEDKEKFRELFKVRRNEVYAGF